MRRVRALYVGSSAVAIALGAVVACGSPGFSTDEEALPTTTPETPRKDGATAGDVSGDDGGQPDPTDGGPRPTTCSPMAPFTRFSELKSLSTIDNDFAITLFDQERKAVFSTSNGTTQGLSFATRASANDPFGEARPIEYGNTNIGDPSFEEDGSSLVFVAATSDGYRPFRGVLETKDAKKLKATQILVPPGFGNIVSPSVRRNGTRIYFVSSLIDEPSYDLYVATLGPAAVAGLEAISDVKPLSELNGKVDEFSPTLSADEKVIYFNRGPNMMVATRDSVTDLFKAPTQVRELAADGSQVFPRWLSADRCRLYYASPNGSQTSGLYDLFVAEREP